MNTSSAAITTHTWDSFSDVQTNQTGLDFFFPWTIRQLYILKMISWVRLGIILMNVLANTHTLYLEIRHKLYLKASYIFAITLTIADLATSCGLALEWFSRHDVPLYVVAIVTSSGTLSVSSTTAIAFDRYLALHAIPLEYKQLITVKKYAVAAFLIIMSASAYGCISNFAFPYGHPVSSLSGFLVSVVFTSATMVLYVALGLYLSKSQTKLQLPPKTRARRLRQTRKILFTFFAIILTNVILCVPHYAFLSYVAIQPAHEQFSVFLNVMLANLFYTVQVTNYTVNPLIFTLCILRSYLPRPCQGHTMKRGRGPHSDTTNEVGSGGLTKAATASVFSVSDRLKST